MILGKLCNFNYKYKIKRICSKRNQVESIVEHFKRKTNRDEEKKKIRKRVSENMTSFLVILFVIQSYELKIQMQRDADTSKSLLYRSINYSSRRKRQNSAI